MKKNIQSILRISALTLAISALAISCDDDNDNNNNGSELTGETRTYNLTAVDGSGVTGTAKFAERRDGSTIVTLDMDGTTSGQSYPVYIRSNSAAETGDAIIDLEPVTGSSGMSTTTISERNNGTDIDYDDLLGLNGYITVHMSGTDEELLSQADIGSNELTATSRTYTLTSAEDSEVAGTVVFTKRMNGNTLVTTNLQGTETGMVYPVTIYNNSITSPGTSAIALTNVNGSTGTTASSWSSVYELDSGTGITYDGLNTFNGHIGVATAGSPTTYVASTNIGSNSLP